MLRVPSSTTRSPVAARRMKSSLLSMVMFSWYRPSCTMTSSPLLEFSTAETMVAFGQAVVPAHESSPFRPSTCIGSLAPKVAVSHPALFIGEVASAKG